jgi:hypothetical protein
MWLCWRLFLLGLGMLARQRRDLILEDMILRQQLAVWERSGRRPRLQQRDRGVSKPHPIRWRASRLDPRCHDQRISIQVVRSLEPDSPPCRNERVFAPSPPIL